MDVLFKSPWGTRSPGPWLRAASSMERWVEAFPGGWQVLLPNGGEECAEQGVALLGGAGLLVSAHRPRRDAAPGARHPLRRGPAAGAPAVRDSG